MKRTPLKRSKIPLKSSKLRSLRINGISDVSTLKREIQALLREFVIKRDGGCVLRHYPETGACDSVLQAEHLVSRARSQFYADTRNVICVCRRHHIFWKPQNSQRYWKLIEQILGPKRWKWYELAEATKTPYHMALGDWKITKTVLKNEISLLGNDP